MSSVWQPQIQTLIQQHRHAKGGKIVDVLAPSVKSGRAVKSRAYCLAHKKLCYLSPCTLHIGGSPCTDNSNMGDKAGEEGKTIVDTLAWLAHILASEHEVFVSENVPSQELVNTIKHLLGHMYHLDVVRDEANPCRLGWPVNRPRQFIVGLHKLKKTPSSVLATFISSFSRITTMTWRDFLVSDHQVHLEEKAWSIARPVVMQRIEARGLDPHDLQALTFEDLMSETEMEQVQDYRANGFSRDCAWSLNQYPRNGRGRVSTEQTLHTVIRNVGIIWDDRRCQWFTSTDLLAAQGFNLTGPPTCSFQHPHSRKRLDTSSQVGNAMHVNSIGAVIAFALEARHKNGTSFQNKLSESLLASRRSSKRKLTQPECRP